MVTLFKSDFYQVDLFQSGNRNLAVTFTEAGNRTLEGNGFGGSFLSKYNFDVLAIKSNRDNWYSDLPLEILAGIDDIIAKTNDQYDHRVGYGSSMGAYAAMLFSRRLNLNVVLAISPQYDIAQNWDQRWKHRLGEVGRISAMSSEHVSSSCKYFVVYDPYDLDALHRKYFEEVIADGNFFAIKVPFAGHPAGYLLRDLKALEVLASSILVKSEPDKNWSLNIRQKRGQSTLYLMNFARHLFQKKKYRWAERIADRVLQEKPRDAEVYIFKSLLAEKLCFFDKAMNYAAIAIAINPQHPSMHIQLARMLSAISLHSSARVYIDRAVELGSGNQNIVNMRNQIIAAAEKG
ncbi:hypothetical protein ACELLULO517_06430 [Acidisoma cellulosilytica]|uniref:Alpha/beta hydrolase n=1 Tax=Acidisoma cellulosilyticum TaxID=2802395 RepID=A0A963Z134_9PROT|nr:hypothetical protein [Acidisoma cellulosilyticum]MCB8879863.1 hypothetical protein [Acidisoma cellulosilyticum]